MAEAKLFLKKPKVKDTTLIYLFFSYNGKRLKYYTGEKIHTSFWNPEKQLARETQKFSEYPEFNDRLRKIKSDVKDIYRKLLNNDIEPTNELIKKELDKRTKFKGIEKKQDLFSFIDKFTEEAKLIKATGTISVYNRTKTHLEDYCKLHNKRIDFEDIDLEFYNSFIAYLTEKDYSQNTIGKNIKVLKTFLNEATDRGINKTLEFKKKKFKRPTEDTEKIYLNLDELERIYILNFSKDKQLDEIRDLFIIGCFTGLRFSDFTELKPENFIDGNKLKIKTFKTNELVYIPLHKYVREILKKYNSRLPKALSNQKMNYFLKHIGSVAKINEDVEVSITKGGKQVKNTEKKYSLIGTHTARRSFATNLFLEKVPSISIMKITGHRTEKSFLRYIRISQEENANNLLDHPFFN